MKRSVNRQTKTPPAEAMPYTFCRQLVLRTPSLPFGKTIDEELVNDLLCSNFFLETIYLASPVLYRECIKLNEGKTIDSKEIQKLKLSLVKYYQRMSSRCTPFGLFSGCSIVDWKDERTQITFAENGNRRHTRPDMHLLCALSQKLALLPGLKEKLCWFPNSSIYTIGDEVRYIEYKYNNGRRVHQITAVANTQYLQGILQQAQKGITLCQARQLLQIDEEVGTDEAEEFVNELLTSQVLVSELEPAVTGNEFTHQVIQVLEKYTASSDDETDCIRNILRKIIQKIKELDAAASYNPGLYKEITELVKTLEIYPTAIGFDEGKLLQTDLFKNVSYGAIDTAIQQEIGSALGFLNKLCPGKKNGNLESFIQRFRERYEDAAVSLQEALDTETGIGYTDENGMDISPLLDGLVLPGKKDKHDYSIQWNSIQQLLFEKLRVATEEKKYCIEFTDEDLADKPISWADLPPSLSVMFRVIDSAENKIMIDSAGGSGAASLLGRFAHGSEEVHKLVKDITCREQELNPDVVFAEIVHLPEDRTGNILLRPSLRQYEIPYLAKPSAEPENQVLLNDIMISVSGNRIKLFSEKLKKEIIPRLSTAHNFSINALPVYRFLCDLQSQDTRQGLGFHWGSMAPQYKFLPRVEYGKIVLHEATWQFDKTDIEELINVTEQDDGSNLKEFADRWRIPTLFLLADGDNELLVDMESKLSLQAFAKTIKSRNSIVLKEFLFDKTGCIKDAAGRPYIGQFIASMVKTEKVCGRHNIGPDRSVTSVIKRKFEPGSEWLYLKLYCGVKSAEKILTELIGPLAYEWAQKGLIKRWFFIRYNDPSFHLRVRFHLTDYRDTGLLMNELKDKKGKTFLSAFIWKLQADTYCRELERYNQDCIDLAEDLFYADSHWAIKFMRLTEGDERENARWPWGFAMINAILSAFEFTGKEKQALVQAVKNNFGREFNADKNLLLQINKKYNLFRNKIARITGRYADDAKDFTDVIICEAKQYGDAVDRIAASIKSVLRENGREDELDNIVTSLIHMSLNRLFPSQARLQEYILYEFLNRYYLSGLKQNAVQEPVFL